MTAFDSCKSFTGLTLGNGVTTIKNGAFSGCTFYTSLLVFPSSLTTIEGGAFSGCRNITGLLSFPSSVTTIGPFAFFATVISAVRYYQGTVIGTSAFPPGILITVAQ